MKKIRSALLALVVVMGLAGVAGSPQFAADPIAAGSIAAGPITADPIEDDSIEPPCRPTPEKPCDSHWMGHND
ncbi:hypothetical protein [Streptosporangium sp. NPDC087985]|uniref:hypothetical protein n=1 Tax=Streptosporangium sp. NPDC087985 TaxID=3366196 RepID=UPI0037F1AD61